MMDKKSVKGIIKQFWYNQWGKFHKDKDNNCIHCNHPAYKRWSHSYNGFIGFCTECNDNWRES